MKTRSIEKFTHRRRVKKMMQPFIFFFGICAVALGVASCGEFVSPSVAVSAAEMAGFTNVSVVSKSGIMPEWSGCSKGDAVAFHMNGKNPIGKEVSFLVCCGLVLKGCTVRF